MRALEEHEMLQRIGVKRRELHHHARGQVARIERKVGAPEARAAAERAGDVPHGRKVTHLLDRHRRAAPASSGARRRTPRSLSPSSVRVAQARGGVEIGAHEIVFELGRLVERVQSASRCRSGLSAATSFIGSSALSLRPRAHGTRALTAYASCQAVACSRVSRKRMSGQRSSISCRLTREGARYTSAPL